MPEIGERKTKGSITGEWDGTTWRRVDAAPSAPVAVGTRKTKNGVVGEWDGTTWRKVAEAEPDAEPEPSDGSGALATGGALAALAAAIPAARGVAGTLANLTTQVAEPAKAAIGFTPRAASAAEPVMRTVASPLLKQVGAVAGRVAGPLNYAKQAYDVATGKQSVAGAGWDLAAGETARRLFRPERVIPKTAQVLQRVATPAAEALGGAGALTTAGGLAGVGGLTAFLGALQHDANRDVPMDYTKRNLTEDIARVLGGTGATDAQMDDPSHPAFRADDSATVTAGEEAGLVAALRRLLRGGA